MFGAKRVTKGAFGAVLAIVAWAALCMGAVSAYADEAADPYAQAIEVGLADGEYSIDLAMEGGSGRASIDSPAKLAVKEGLGVVTIRWSSPNYDYMLVDGVKYLNETQDINENSTFTIPVLAMDEPFDVTGDTTAMGTPHEIDYSIALDSSSVVEGAPAIPEGVAEETGKSGADTSAALDTSDSAERMVAEAEDAATDDIPEEIGGVPIGWAVGGVIIVVAVIGVIIGVIKGRRSR